MYYSMNGRVRYSETDANKNLTLTGIVNYMQDTCMLQSEECGVGLDALKADKRAWFLSAWQIVIDKVPQLYDRIEVVTNPYDFKGFFGYRNFFIKDETGETCITANSVWVYMDVEHFVPARIPEKELAAYAPYMPKAEMDYAPRKMKLPDGFEACDPIPVHSDMIDTNHHVNNSRYIEIALGVAGLTGLPREIRVEYRKQAMLGDTFYPYIHRDEKNIVVDLRDETGASFAPVMFLL